jgi:hypothetical protein
MSFTIKYGAKFSKEAIIKNLHRLINQIFKLLPCREEGEDWRKSLHSILEELSGMTTVLPDYQEQLFSLLCKLEGLFYLSEEGDFQLYRRTVFECLSILGKIKEEINNDD